MAHETRDRSLLHKTIEIALALNLEFLLHACRELAESNGMAEAFVKTFKRAYVHADTALALIENSMEDDNTVHPHSRLGYRSPREHIATPS